MQSKALARNFHFVLLQPRVWTNVVLLTVVKILSIVSICFGRVKGTCHLFVQYQFGPKHKILKLSKEKFPPASNY